MSTYVGVCFGMLGYVRSMLGYVGINFGLLGYVGVFLVMLGCLCFVVVSLLVFMG